jgi:hypothetical protein
MSTLSSSNPSIVIDGFSSLMPRFFMAATTFLTSDVSSTGMWKGYGAGSRGGNPVGMQLGDVLIHIQSSGTAKPGFVSMHSVIASSANVASTTLSSGFNAAYDITVSACT